MATPLAPKPAEQAGGEDSTPPKQTTESKSDSEVTPSSAALVEESPAPSDKGDETKTTGAAAKDAGEEPTAAANEDGTPTYRDFSHVKPEEGETGVLLSPNKEPTFIVKLHQMLSNPEIEDIISWLPHGRAWRILQRKAFEEQVIPLYFRHCRYSSFMRQVNGWGFQRICHGPDYNAYYHEMFLRGMPHLCHKMRRLTSRDTEGSANSCKGRQPKNESEEQAAPDFYKISEKNPLPEATFVPRPPLPTVHGRISDAALMRKHGAMLPPQGFGPPQAATMGYGGMPMRNHFAPPAGMPPSDLDMARHRQMMGAGMPGPQPAFGGMGMHQHPGMVGSQYYGLPPPPSGMPYMNPPPHAAMGGSQQMDMQMAMAEQQRASDAAYDMSSGSYRA